MDNVTPVPQTCNPDLALSDLSERDASWDHHRANADVVQIYYGTSSRSARLAECAQDLGFLLVPDSELGEYQLKLAIAHFCRVRYCTVCQWRRSLMWKARAYEVFPQIVRDYPAARFLFLTLSPRNCAISDLRETLTLMNKSFAKMVRYKAWPAIGWLRSTEVIRGRDGVSAHPHFHCLLMVKGSYFSTKKYLNHDDWLALWQRALKVDYKPHAHVSALNKKIDPVDLIPELLKYSTKESDLIADKDWFWELTKQTHKMRFVSTSGIIKQYLSSLEEEPDDLIGEGDDGRPDEGKLFFSWRKEEKRYRYRETARELEREREGDTARD